MVCPHGQGGLSQCGHFADKGGGINFLRFCADVFYGRPLIIIGSFAFQYLIMKSIKLKYVDLVNIEGVEFDTNFNYSVHCLNISNKASTTVNVLLRAFFMPLIFIY